MPLLPRIFLKLVYTYELLCSELKDMVAQPKESIALVAVVLISTVNYCSIENVYCVTPLPPHAHPALTIQPTAPHSLSMHKKLDCVSTICCC